MMLEKCSSQPYLYMDTSGPNVWICIIQTCFYSSQLTACYLLVSNIEILLAKQPLCNSVFLDSKWCKHCFYKGAKT